MPKPLVMAGPEDDLHEHQTLLKEPSHRLDAADRQRVMTMVPMAPDDHGSAAEKLIVDKLGRLLQVVHAKIKKAFASYLGNYIKLQAARDKEAKFKEWTT